MDKFEINKIEERKLAEKERWEHYREANDKFPEVRNAELSIMKTKVDPQKGEVIVECGTGNGYLTFPLAEAVGKDGKIITYDTTSDNLQNVKDKNSKLKLPIETRRQPFDYHFEEEDESVDKIASIATFHHYDNRNQDTGYSGRVRALKEFFRILKKGGKLIIGDVAKGTEPQKYFDSIDNPKYCYPDGHPHDFLDEETARKICAEAGLKITSFEVVDTPWVFDDEKQAALFLHTIHNSKVEQSDSLEHAKKFLTPRRDQDGKFSLGWKLFYLIAEKK